MNHPDKFFIHLNGFLILVMLLVTLPSLAEVTRIEITSRQIFADGESFGSTGPYEKIRGKLFYAVDPDHPANLAVVDLKLAPRNTDGRVEFVGDFFLLKPLDLSRGNHRILYDVNNRGNLVMMNMNDARSGNDPSTAQHAGNGFLMRQGYSLLWSAWNWDVRTGRNRLQIELPIATMDGKPIRQKIAAEIVLSFNRQPVKSQPLAWGGSRCYTPVDMADPEAILTVRDSPRGERTIIPREQWQFARFENGHVCPDPTYLYLESGLQPGKIYELIYETQNPRVVGLSLTSVRDAISFFRFDAKDSFGNMNPLSVLDNDGERKPDAEKSYIFGVSQSGRFITHMIFQGFHVDEKDRMVIDGARIHVAGGGKGGFNHRFAQTTHHPSDLEGNYMPADFFPFNYASQTDPVTGRKGDVLAVAKRLGKIPKIMTTNNELEYWTRSASLIHTDVEGKKDADMHENVRIYVTSGAPHGNGSRRQSIYEHGGNTLRHYAISRALLVALDQWVTKGVEPPPSQYPRIGEGELISAKEHGQRFPKIPGMRHPGRNLQPARVDYGPDFWSKWIFTVVPPKMEEPFISMVPAFDEDGNPVGGIRLPDLSVPLGTYQGWNPRKAEFGAPDFLGRFAGSFWMFPLTEEDRKSIGDPRKAIEARYRSKEDYVTKVEQAVDDLIQQRFLLKEDGNIFKDHARRISWPPEMTNQYPFWKMEN